MFETKSTVYQKLVVAKAMPPSASPQPAQGDRDKVGNWILGGAPFGSGPANTPPTFAWSAPSATQSSGTTATLTWSAMDVEGLASGKLEWAHLNDIASSGCTVMTTMSATWAAITDPKASATLTGAKTWADSFAWTINRDRGPVIVGSVRLHIEI